MNTPVTLFKHASTTYVVSFLEEGAVSLSAAGFMKNVPPERGYVSHAVLFNAQGNPTRMEAVAVLTLDNLRERMETYGFDVDADRKLVNGTRRIRTIAYPAEAVESGTLPRGTVEQDTENQPCELDMSNLTQAETLLQRFVEARASLPTPFLKHL